jgi:hypothetical protein
MSAKEKKSLGNLPLRANAKPTISSEKCGVFALKKAFLHEMGLSAIQGLRCRFKVLLNASPITDINLSA